MTLRSTRGSPPTSTGSASRRCAYYVRARELKAAGLDWTDILAESDENPRARLAAELMASTSYESVEARAEAFVAQGGGCRATFYN